MHRCLNSFKTSLNNRCRLLIVIQQSLSRFLIVAYLQGRSEAFVVGGCKVVIYLI